MRQESSTPTPRVRRANAGSFKPGFARRRALAPIPAGKEGEPMSAAQGGRPNAGRFKPGRDARRHLHTKEERSKDADKRRAVEALLADPELSRWSNREVARRCGVTHTFVGACRKRLTGSRAPEAVRAKRGGVEYSVSTRNLAVPKAAGACALLKRIEAALPRSLPHDEREDARQSAALDVLAGRLSPERITPRSLRPYVLAARGMTRDRFRFVSLSSPTRDGREFGETLEG